MILFKLNAGLFFEETKLIYSLKALKSTKGNFQSAFFRDMLREKSLKLEAIQM